MAIAYLPSSEKLIGFAAILAHLRIQREEIALIRGKESHRPRQIPKDGQYGPIQSTLTLP
jgi:hypothetical protein